MPNYRQSLFCDSCRLYLRDETAAVERVTYNRRFWGSYLLEGLLITVTLFVGWLIWLWFTSKTGQSPAKRLLNLYVLKIDTGRGIGRGDTWIREVLVKIVAINAIGFVIPFASLIDAVWIFFDKNRQTLHDKLLSQVVVYAPAGLPEGMLHQHNAIPRYALPGTSGAPVNAAPGSVQDTAAQLRELARLRDEGTITAEEYEAKRAQLVNRL
jgi:uncharacterized RDD family membrane protein YckC